MQYHYNIPGPNIGPYATKKQWKAAGLEGEHLKHMLSKICNNSLNLSFACLVLSRAVIIIRDFLDCMFWIFYRVIIRKLVSCNTLLGKTVRDNIRSTYLSFELHSPFYVCISTTNGYHVVSTLNSIIQLKPNLANNKTTKYYDIIRSVSGKGYEWNRRRGKEKWWRIRTMFCSSADRKQFVWIFCILFMFNLMFKSWKFVILNN